VLRSRPRSDAGTAADAVMLEADVMRFMAILAFCLMVVFALIQAIPPSRPDSGVKLDTEQLLRERQRATTAEAELQAARQRLAERERVLEASRRRLENLRAEAARSRAEVAGLERRLAAATQAEDPAPPGAAPAPPPPADDAPDPPPPTPSATASATEPVAETAAAPPEPEPTPPSRSPERGYTLRFDSTEAIRALVRDGRVELYAELGGQLWRARRSLAFETASAPQASYELTDSPGNRLVEGFRRSAGVMSARSPRWLVDFDPRLLGEIRNALGSADSGADVVIEQNGRVRVDAAAAP